MRSTSAVFDRALRVAVVPVLRGAGFHKVNARNGWLWTEKSIWVFNIRAVGNYFSLVTGWPPGSVGVWLGIYFVFIPTDFPVKFDDKGRMLPAEFICHMRSHLKSGLNQDDFVSQLALLPERQRKDLWWIEPDGSNSVPVAEDIASSLRNSGLSWFSHSSNLTTALTEVESGHDCFVKFDTAAFLAREIDDRDRWQKYALLAEAMATKIGRSIDRRSRYGI